MTQPNRPTSPHLTVYRWQITMILSILHRATGVALYAGTALIIGFLVIMSYAPMHFEQMHECLASIPGRLILFGWTLAFFYHFYNGLRHLFWDMGKGFEIASVNRSGWLSLFATLVSTLGVWAYAYHVAGAF
jgi:succinate dehydrogenase / fumarate reductase, cytochrome b subunit